MTAYFCWKCKTKEHWANEVCPKDAVPVVASPVGGSAPTATPVAAFRKVGRPKIYSDRKTQMREVMRRKRLRDRAGKAVA